LHYFLSSNVNKHPIYLQELNHHYSSSFVTKNEIIDFVTSIIFSLRHARNANVEISWYSECASDRDIHECYKLY